MLEQQKKMERDVSTVLENRKRMVLLTDIWKEDFDEFCQESKGLDENIVVWALEMEDKLQG